MVTIKTYETPVVDYYGIDTGTISIGFIFQHDEESDQYSLLGFRYSDGREEIFEEPIICVPSSMEISCCEIEYPDKHRGGTSTIPKCLSNSEIAMQKYVRENNKGKDRE